MPFIWQDPNIPPAGRSDSRSVSGDDGHSLSPLDSSLGPVAGPSPDGTGSTRRPSDWGTHSSAGVHVARTMTEEERDRRIRLTNDPCFAVPGSTIPAMVVSKLQRACRDGGRREGPLAPFPRTTHNGTSRSVYAFTLCPPPCPGIGIRGVFCPNGYVLDEDGACESLPALVEMLDELQYETSDLVGDFYCDISPLALNADAADESDYRGVRLTILNEIANSNRCTLDDALGYLTRTFLTQSLERRVPEHLRGSANAARRTQFVYMDDRSYSGMLGEVEYDFEPHMLRFPDC